MPHAAGGAPPGSATAATEAAGIAARGRVLDPVDRVSELVFGLLMALTFVGALSVAEAGREQLRDLYVTALGCNLAWGLVDAVMYLVRTVTERGRALTLLRSVRAAPDAAEGRALIATTLARDVAAIVPDSAVEAVRQRMLAVPHVPARPALGWGDVVAAVAIFLVVVASTFPVVLPFALLHDVALAKTVSRLVALAMLFGAGLALGRYAGYGTWRTGFAMAGVGTALVVAIRALGG